jgi:hypothetical protein
MTLGWTKLDAIAGHRTAHVCWGVGDHSKGVVFLAGELIAHQNSADHRANLLPETSQESRLSQRNFS